MLILVMGVSGSGKSTVAAALASKLGWKFLEGDNFHPQSNKEKMTAGIALTDEDRWPWLQEIAQAIHRAESEGENTVLACSALKEKYREVLRHFRDDAHVVWLRGTQDLIAKRMKAREHFMNPALLDSQLNTIEAPQDALIINIEDSPDKIVSIILEHLDLHAGAEHEIA